MEPPVAIVPEKPKRPRAKWYWRVLRVLALAYVGILVMLYFAQNQLIFPGAATQGQPEAQVKTPPDCELLDLKTADGTTIKALFGPARRDGQLDPNAKTRPTILFCYGNAMCIHAAKPQFDEFRDLDFNVIIPEYAGYGLSAGAPSEAGCIGAAEAAYDHLLTRPDVDKSKIIISGWSLGGAVAIGLAARKPAAGLAVFSTFTSMAEMGHNLYPFLPATALSAILKHRFDSIHTTAEVKCPILIGHGTADPMIPHAMSRHLTAAAKTPVTRLNLEGAGHNDFFSHDPEKLNAALKEFVEKCCGQESK